MEFISSAAAWFGQPKRFNELLELVGTTVARTKEMATAYIKTVDLTTITQQMKEKMAVDFTTISGQILEKLAFLRDYQKMPENMNPFSYMDTASLTNVLAQILVQMTRIQGLMIPMVAPWISRTIERLSAAMWAPVAPPPMNVNGTASPPAATPARPAATLAPPAATPASPAATPARPAAIPVPAHASPVTVSAPAAAPAASSAAPATPEAEKAPAPKPDLQPKPTGENGAAGDGRKYSNKVFVNIK